MQTATTAIRLNADQISEKIIHFLEEKKSQDIVSLNLVGKSSIADYMIVASGTSQRHIQATGELLKEYLHSLGVTPVIIEGTPPSDWVLLDAGDVIIHLFRPEVREHYNLEKMWGVDLADFSRKAAGEA